MIELKNIFDFSYLPVSYLTDWIQPYPLPEILHTYEIATNWQEMFLISSTALAIIGVVSALFSGSFLYTLSFALLGSACYTGYYFAKQYCLLKGLEHQVDQLESANRSLSKLSAALVSENDQFKKSNIELLETNEKLRAVASTLQTQVVSLQLSLVQLQSSSAEMKQQVSQFVLSNSHLATHVSGFDILLKRLDGELLLSQGLCKEVQRNISSQREDLGGKLQELGDFLRDLKAENRTLEKMQELLFLQRQILEASSQLGTLHEQYASERGRLEAVRIALENERVQFEALRKEFASQLSSDREQFKELFERVARIFLSATSYPDRIPREILAY